MQPQINRCHPLNQHFGRATIEKGVSIQNSHLCKQCLNDKHVNFCKMVFHFPHALYAYKSYWLCDICDKRLYAENISCRQ